MNTNIWGDLHICISVPLKDGTISTHHRNLQTLATEIFRVKNQLSPKITSDFSTRRIRITKI